MQEERHAHNGCARGRRKVTRVSRSHSQTGTGCWCMFPSDRLTVFLRTGMPQAA
jgi:hypothetical protein